LAARLGSAVANGYRRGSLEKDPPILRRLLPFAFLAVALAFIAGIWWWSAQPIVLAHAPIDPQAKLECVSYAPFRNGQSPLELTTHISAEQIADDLKRLAGITDCIRTYSVDNGLDQVPALAQKAGLKVIHGIWLGGNRIKNRVQIETSIALAKQFPDVIIAVVVGNEVLLRGEMTSSDLAATIRLVKGQIGNIPVTYADVWEYWLRYREIYDAVDFITIHILPYWEDFPIPASNAAAHVDTIRKQVVVAFPNKEILIGETGWPSEGRMREGALPSRANQARVVSEILALARTEKFRVNLIEAYDQPWKRQLEGTVGGYWGVMDATSRVPKYPAGEPISNFPRWRHEMAAGLAYCLLVFAVGWLAQRRKPWSPPATAWLALAVSAAAGGSLLGFGFEKFMVESLGIGPTIKWGVLLAAGIVSPFVAAVALLAGKSLPTLIEVIGPRQLRERGALSFLLGAVLVIAMAIGSETALGFVFDPRYRDFPYAALTMAVLPLALVSLQNARSSGVRQIAESIFAGLLTLSVVYIAINETVANWQSDWTCAVYLVLAVTLFRARGAQTQE
jgi:glucan 1,3-beta-glucosidase